MEHRGHDDRVFNEPNDMNGFFEPVLQGVVDLARCGTGIGLLARAGRLLTGIELRFWLLEDDCCIGIQAGLPPCMGHLPIAPALQGGAAAAA